MRLHHVNVVVPPGATDRVAPFYELLGLVRVPKATGRASGAWFDVPGGTQVHVSERPGEVHPDAHFALVVDELDALVQRLAQAGHPTAPLAPLGGSRRATTADPVGNRVELIDSAGTSVEEPA